MIRVVAVFTVFTVLLAAGWASVLGSAWFWAWVFEVPFDTALLYTVALGFGANSSFNLAKRVL